SLDWDWLTQSPKGGGLVPGSPARGLIGGDEPLKNAAMERRPARVLDRKRTRRRKAASKTWRCPALRPLRPGRRGKLVPAKAGIRRPASPGRQQQGRYRMLKFQSVILRRDR